MSTETSSEDAAILETINEWIAANPGKLPLFHDGKLQVAFVPEDDRFRIPIVKNGQHLGYAMVD